MKRGWLRGLSDLRVITFKADEKLIELTDKTAKKLGITRSELIRSALLEYCGRVMRHEGNH